MTDNTPQHDRVDSFTEAQEQAVADEILAIRGRVNAIALLPAPFLAAAIMVITIGTPPWLALVLGAAGWMAALVLRQPVALIAMRLTTRERMATIVGWFSGPAEELVRLALVLLVIRTVEEAAWAGFGWAAIEVVIVAINVLAISSLMTKTDAKSMEAKQLLQDQGMITPTNPFWGLLERLSATAMHIGFTLMLFASPWLVLVTLPLHSIVNMASVKLVKRNVAAMELGFLVIAAVVLATGITLAVG